MALRLLHAAARSQGHRRERGGAPGVRDRTEPRRPVPPGGDARDHGRLGQGLPARARRARRRPRSAPRGDARGGRGDPGDESAAPRRLPGADRADRGARVTAATAAVVTSDRTKVFPRLLDAACVTIERGEGVRLYATDGREILDACGGGAMVASLGHGRRDIVDAAARQAEELSYVYYHHFTNELQERLAERILEVAAPSMARIRFVSGGSEANEMALRLARQYHEERGDTGRWRAVSPAQAYHGATVGALGLTGRLGLQAPYEPYLAGHLHIPPATARSDPSGEKALAALDRVLAEAGDSVAAYFCEPISGAALPAYSPPARFWEGLAERRDKHGDRKRVV